MLETLSQDVVLHVMEFLSAQETQNLVLVLQDAYAHTHDQRTLDLACICYTRLYAGRNVVYSNVESACADDYATCMTVDSFADKFHSVSLDAKVFRATRPQHTDFVFIRQPTDYTKFVRDLNGFSDMLDSPGTVSQYLAQSFQFGLHIDGKCVSIEAPSSFLVSILKVIISMSTVASDSGFCQKLNQITIKSTDIGQYYMGHWSQLFGRCIGVTRLDLTDNLIKSDSYIYDAADVKDILGTTFSWPPHLEELVLDQNFINYISPQLVSRLPQSLRRLSMRNNWLYKIGDCNDVFDLSSALPNLEVLDLSHNNRLTYINPCIFKSSKGALRSLNLKGCNLDNENLYDITKYAKLHGFTVYM